ncbi:DNA polymerase alpha accessory factor Mcl1 [Dimargaris xerosporica]|nr:DNA polymerase alpha accessory factor Mcl1 [Dimargaris xerosporica]
MPDHLSDLQPRFAHIEGFCPVVFSTDGSYIFTGGADCLVRGFQTAPELRDQESRTLESQTDSITCLAVATGYLAVGSEDNTVVLYQVPSLEYQGIAMRGTLPIRDVQFSYDGKYVGVASDEQHVRLVQVDNIAQTIVLKGHAHSVRSLTFHPSRSLVATVDSEGTVRVWDYSNIINGEGQCTHTLSKYAARSDPDSPFAVKVQWHPSGQYLAVPRPDHSIAVLGTTTELPWRPAMTLSQHHKGIVTHCAWSANGVYLASVDTLGGFALWHLPKQSAIFYDTHKTPITQVAWCPQGNILALMDNLGMLTVWDQVIPEESGLVLPATTDPTAFPGQAPPETRHTAAQDHHDATLNPEPLSANIPFAALADSEAGMDDDDVPRAAFQDTGSDLDDFIVDDYPDAHERRQPSRSGSHQRYTTAAMPIGARHRPLRHAILHPSFQPGATPLLGQRRFLSFNMVGSITSIDHDTHCTINVDFHDKSMHRDFHFTDHYKYNLASLGERGILFGTTAKDGDAADHNVGDEPSMVSYRPFESWAANSDWLYKLPAGEQLVALSLSNTHAAVATSQGYLRIFSSSGLPVAVLTIDPQVVCVASGGPYFLVVYRSNASSNNPNPALLTTTLGYLVYDAERQIQLQQGVMPLPASVGLQWAGFSDTQLPALYDTRGILHVLDKYRIPAQGHWVPVWDGTVLVPSKDEELLTNDPHALEESDEWLWVIGLSHTQVHGILCAPSDASPKSRKKQHRSSPHYRFSLARMPPCPQAVRPLISQVGLRMPLLHRDQAATTLEEKLLRTHLFATNKQTDSTIIRPRSQAALNATDPAVLKSYLQEDKLALQLIQNACKADRLQRALDLTAMLYLPKSVEAAVKIAIFHRYPALAERMTLIKEATFLDEDEELVTDGYDNGIASATLAKHPVHNVPGRHASTGRPQYLRKPVAPLSRADDSNVVLMSPTPTHSVGHIGMTDGHGDTEEKADTGGMVIAPTALTPKPAPLPTNPFAIGPSSRKENQTDRMAAGESIPRGNSFFNAVDRLMQPKDSEAGSVHATTADALTVGKADGNGDALIRAESKKRAAQATLASFAMGTGDHKRRRRLQMDDIEFAPNSLTSQYMKLNVYHVKGTHHKAITLCRHDANPALDLITYVQTYLALPYKYHKPDQLKLFVTM